MPDDQVAIASRGHTLCRACGLCCDGHLFSWAKLRPAELDQAEALGLRVFRSNPNARGFSQPCPLWNGVCTIYDSPHYPRVCRAYQCKLLRQLMSQEIDLSSALGLVKQAKAMIAEVDSLLPASSVENFRDRLVAQLESSNPPAPRRATQSQFREKAATLLNFYDEAFGVDDVIENAEGD